LVICVAVLIQAAVSATAARPTPEEVLLRMLVATRGVNMIGTEVSMVTPPHMAGITMTRKVVRTKEGVCLSRCISPSSQKGFIAYDDGNWIKSYDPIAKDIKVARSSRRAQTDKAVARLIRLIKRNYKLVIENRESIAGRDCYILAFRPVHKDSHEVKCWVDTRTGAILSNVENNPRGHTVAVTFFTSVQFPSQVPASAIQNPLPNRVPVVNLSRSPILRDIGKMRRIVGFDVCIPYAMPAGYEFQHCEAVSFNGMPATCLRYTDGMADITVYQSASSESLAASRPSLKMSVHPLGNTVVEYRNGPANFMIVGRTEQDGLLDVARALNMDRERTILNYFGKNYVVPSSALTVMRNRGMGTDVMDALLSIRQQARQPLHKLLALHDDGMSWTTIAQQFKVNVKAISSHIKPFKCR
jgi:negative regulator of sigma E activity